MQTSNTQKFIAINNNIINGTGLNKFTNEFVFKTDWYKQQDYISINSVRVNDMFLADGTITYTVSNGALK
jgi:hypothetical protein